MKRIAILVALVWLLALPSARGDEFVLVEAGGEPTPIVVFAGAPPRTRAAAVELADYVEKICGRRPAIIDGEPRPIPQRAIWVGYQPAVEPLFPQTDFKFHHPEETLIVVGRNHAVVAGRDRWNPARLDVEGGDGTIRGKQQEYGTVNAVYSFLQDQLGVRWLWPGELGEDLIHRDRIALATCELRYHPQIRSRGASFISRAWEIKVTAARTSGPYGSDCNSIRLP